MANKPFKLLVMAGHGRNVDGTWDPGAIGNGYREADLTRELSGLIVSEAKRRGIDCDQAPDRNHYSFFKHGGEYDVTQYTYVLEVHFNASTTKDEVGDGLLKGSMCYISRDEKGQSVEEAILNNLYSIGSRQAWDGVVITQRQWPSGLMVQNHIRRQGVSHAVLETCFITDLDDMIWYRDHKREAAAAIVQGIITGFGLERPAVVAHGKAREEMNVRTYASIWMDIVGVVPAGGVVDIVEILADGWLKIRWNGGIAYTSNKAGKYYDITPASL